MSDSKKIVWDDTGSKIFEYGLDRGVHYTIDDNGAYVHGVPWNGLTKVDEKPTGAESNDIYADNIKYGSIQGAEKFEAGIEAFTYPDQFAECDGSTEVAPGAKIGQQARKPFGFSYRSLIGNDVKGEGFGYKIHLVYGCKASPSDKSRETVNDSVDAMSMSWDLTTTPVNVTGYKPTATFEIDSTRTDATKLAAIEEILYGTDDTEARMPLPDEIIALLKGETSSASDPTNP